jgi:hypothetical protein
LSQQEGQADYVDVGLQQAAAGDRPLIALNSIWPLVTLSSRKRSWPGV